MLKHSLAEKPCPNFQPNPSLPSRPRYPSLSKWHNRRKGLRTTSLSLLLGLLPWPSAGRGCRVGASVSACGAALAAGAGPVRDPRSALRAPADRRCPVQPGLSFSVFPFLPRPGFAIVSPRNQPSPQPRSTAGKAGACAGPGKVRPGVVASRCWSVCRAAKPRASPAAFGFLPGEDQPGFGAELCTLLIFLVFHPKSLKARRVPLRFVSLMLICHRVRLASVAEMYSRH